MPQWWAEAHPTRRRRSSCHRRRGIRAIAASGDPTGGAQDARRFSMRQDASSKNPGHGSGGRFELDLCVFFTRAYGARPSGRLRRSRRKRRSGHFLFEKKVARAPARKGFRAFAEDLLTANVESSRSDMPSHTHPRATRRRRSRINRATADPSLRSE